MNKENQQSETEYNCYVCNKFHPGTDKYNMLQNIGLESNTAKRMIRTCSHMICHQCLLDTKNRAKNSTFYQEYIGVCSDCIWWDIG